MTTAQASRDLLAAADGAIDLVRVDRAAARAVCRRVLAAAVLPADCEAAAVAERVLAIAELHDDRPAVALGHVRRAIELAAEAGSPRRESEARMTALGVYGVLGRLPEAEAEADLAAQLADTPLGRIRVEVQRAAVYRLFDRHEEAVARLDRALELLREHGDPFTEAVVYHNRGTAFVELGEPARARADLVRAGEIHRRLGHEETYRTTQVHVARLAAVDGDVPVALRLFDVLRTAGDTSPDSLYDLAECFLAARLFDDAAAAASAAADRCGDEHGTLLPAIRLCEARARLSGGDAGGAAVAADLAASRFATAGRHGAASVARAVAFAARVDGGAHQEVTAGAVADLAAPLLRQGMTDPVVDAILLLGRVATKAGVTDAAVDGLARVAGLRSSPVLHRRTAARYAAALLAAGDGRAGAALRLLAGAVRDVERHGAGVVDIELHAAMLDLGRLVSELGVELVAERRDARRLLVWAERSNLGAFGPVAVTPPADPVRQRLLADLRRLSRSSPDDAADAERARRRGRLERELRHHAHTRPTVEASVSRPLPRRELLDALDDRALVMWVRAGRRLVAVTAVRGRFRYAELGDVAAVEPVRRLAERELARHGRGRGRHPDGLDAACGALDAVVLGPLRRAVGDRELVLVPTPLLLSVPWAALPTLTDRPFTVAPSAAAWVVAHRRLDAFASEPRRRLYATAGPGLAGAASEVRRIAARYEDARAVSGAAATTEDFLRGMAEADVVHVAAHGELRPDNALLSSVLLADGPLTVYDLEQAGRLPPVWVLAACDVGRLSDRAGRRLLGLAAALLRFGAASVVASTVEIDDAASAPVAARLHDHLVERQPPGAALRALRGELGDDTVAGPVARSLVCLGAG